MSKSIWIIIYLFILAANIGAGELNNQNLQYISKPLLMIVLLSYFLLQVKTKNTPLKAWIGAAIFFSWIGDVLLLFQEQKPIFFLLGLSAFLIAHIFYIVFFDRIKKKENIKSNAWLLLVVVVYYATLISILLPHLGSMKYPVCVYGIVISFMFMLSMHTLFMKDKQPAQWLATGALLFVISDSLLAINKFYEPFSIAGIAIMITYGLAQLFITTGAIRYINFRT